MLLHAILLLLGSLAAAEFTRPCDTSLIRGVTTGEVSFDYYDPSSAGDRLRARCAGNYSLAAIKLVSGPDNLRSNLFDSLTCDASKGWTVHAHSPKERHHYDIANASSPVTIACFEYCPVESPSGEIIARRTSDDMNTLSVECPAGHELFDVKPDRRNARPFAGAKLSCSLGKGWTRIDSTSLEANTSAPLQVECRDYSHCDTSLLDGDGPQRIKFRAMYGNEKYYHCPASYSSSEPIHVTMGIAELGRFSELRCDDQGWHGVIGRNDLKFLSKDTNYLFTSCSVNSTQGGKRSVRAMRTAEGKQEEYEDRRD